MMKWCSRCKLVYSDDYSICPECDAPLVEEIPPKPEKPKLSHKLIEAYKEKSAYIESESIKAEQKTYIPRDNSLLWLAAIAYFPICYGLTRIFHQIIVLIFYLPFYNFARIVNNFVFPSLFYAIIFALSFAFIRYFFRMDNKPYSYFSIRNILIIASASVLLEFFSGPVISMVTSLAYPFSDINMILFYIAVLIGDAAKIALLAFASVLIWKLTFQMPQRTFRLFTAAYFNACGAIAFAISLLLIVISALLSYFSWRFSYNFYDYNLMTYIDLLTGVGLYFPAFDSFRNEATILLCMVPIFYQYKPRRK